MLPNPQQSPAYNLKKIALVSSKFEIPGPDFEPEEDLSIEVDINSGAVNENRELDIKLSIVLRGTSTKEIFIHVAYVGRFQVLRDDAEVSIPDFSNINAPAIIYPYIRQYVRALTLEAGFTQPVILPIINFVELQNMRRKQSD